MKQNKNNVSLYLISGWGGGGRGRMEGLRELSENRKQS
jgi:hypothetical protein